MYFECNLPREIPSYYHPNIADKLEDTVDLVYERTDKLNDALEYCLPDMSPATFHKFARMIFDNLSGSCGVEHFDQMAAEELASAVRLLWDGKYEAPERIEWPNATVLFDTAFVSTKDWEALRHFGIGGSDSSVVMGLSHYQTEEGLFHDKIGTPELIVDHDKQKIFDRGHFMEDKVVAAFCRLTGAVEVPESRMFQSKKYPCSTANIDRILRMPSGQLSIFEAKSAIAEKKGDWMGQKIPADYQCQCHQYPGVLDDPRIDGTYIGMIPVADIDVDGTYIGSAYANDFYHHFVERDPEKEQEIMEAETDFWKTYIENGIKPKPSMNYELDKEVSLRFEPSPISDPEIPAKDDLVYEDYEEIISRLKTAEIDTSNAKRQYEQLENYRNTIRAEVLTALTGAQIGIFKSRDGKPVFQVKNTLCSRVSYDSKKMKARFPDAYAECHKDNPYTKFSFKDLALV